MRRLAILPVVLLLAGCSGGAAAKVAGPPKPAAVAEAIGCAGFTATTTEEIYVQAVGTCTIGGDDAVRVLTFNDNEGRDAFVTTAKSFGGNYAVGDRFAVEATSATVDAIDGKGGASRA